MNAAQLQHLKLWFAGKSKNWELAAFELRQLTDSLAQAAVLYPGIPVSNVTTMKDPLLSIADAIDAGDGRRFTASMRALTDRCNACHTSLERSFIAIGLPRPTSRRPPIRYSRRPKRPPRNDELTQTGHHKDRPRGPDFALDIVHCSGIRKRQSR
ncbi:hypothetical protein [Bradyrhizobium barranii]